MGLKIKEKYSSPCTKRSAVDADSPSKIKLTILNLSGVRIKEAESRKESKTNGTISDAAITASISFTGSCEPKKMRVVSSNICPISGRICVESRPVVVPNGMTDGLVAVWDDSPESLSDEYGSSLSGRGNGLKGSILAEPNAKPHLYVDLETDSQNCGCDDLLMTPTLTASSTLPSYDDSSNISSLSRLSSFENDLSPQTNPSPLTVEKTPPTTSLLDLDDNMEKGFALINTPLDTNDSSSIPEILELNLALHINQIPNGNGDCPDICDIKSTCPPCLEGGGAVAHLVLFPDIFTRDPGKGVDKEFEHGDGWRILEIPVRKREVPYISSNASELSGFTTTYSNIQAKHSTSHKSSEALFDEFTWIDLDDDATIRLRLEKCNEEDTIGMKMSDDDLKEQYYKATPIDYSLHNISEDGELMNRSNKSDKSKDGDADWKDGIIHLDFSKNKNIDLSDKKSNATDQNCNQSQTPVADSDKNTKLSPESGFESSSGEEKNSRSSMIFCNNELTLQGVFDAMTGIVTNCRENVGAVNFETRSMCSTICTADMKR